MGQGLGTPRNATRAAQLYGRARLLGRTAPPRRNPGDPEPSPYGTLEDSDGRKLGWTKTRMDGYGSGWIRMESIQIDSDILG